MAAITDAVPDGLGGDPDAAIRQLYSHYAKALHGYVDQFCPDRASADDIVQETFIRAWRHLPQLSADDRPVRPWLFRVARNLLIDANRAARARPMTVPGERPRRSGPIPGWRRSWTGSSFPPRSSTCRPRTRPYSWRPSTGAGPLATVARELGIPHGTARSRLHYALDAMRKQLEEHDAIAAS